MRRRLSMCDADSARVRTTGLETLKLVLHPTATFFTLDEDTVCPEQVHD